MNTTLECLRARARNNPRRILFPETNDPRIRDAAELLAEQGLCVPVFLSSPARPVPGCEVFTEREDHAEWRQQAIVAYAAKRTDRTEAEATEALNSPLTLAAALVDVGYADAGVAGAVETTADVLRACLRGIGLAANSKLVSSVFLVEDGDDVHAFGDCAVNPEPDAGQLAQIALDSAATFHRLTGQEPKVAMLSFSTLGSADHPAALKVREATAIVKQRAPDLAVDGELQFDAAFSQNVAQAKAPDSPVAGQANVFVFPDLNAANIGYKIAERMGGAHPVGPILQGLSKPWLDLSRGCDALAIADAAVIASVLSMHD